MKVMTWLPVHVAKFNKKKKKVCINTIHKGDDRAARARGPYINSHIC